MIQLDSMLYFSFKINDMEIPLGPSTVDSILITEHMLQHLPALRVENFRDKTGVLSSLKSLNDGAKVTVMMGRTPDEAEETALNFRIVDMKPSGRGVASTVYTFYGVLDFLPFLIKKPRGGYTGSSSQVLKALAQETGLKYDLESTNDQMTWLPPLGPVAGFVKELARRGYVNDESAMAAAVSAMDGGTLLYRNLNDLEGHSSKPYPRFYEDSRVSLDGSREFRTIGHSFLQGSGMANLMYGYGYEQSEQTLSGEHSRNTTVQAKRSISNNFELSKEVQAMFQGSNIRAGFAAPECGNTHSNYEKAYHQNLRLRALFSTHYRIMIDKVSSLNLFDLVDVDIYDTTTRKPADVHNASYVVTAKARMVRGTGYKERLQVTSTGKALEIAEDQKLDLT